MSRRETVTEKGRRIEVKRKRKGTQRDLVDSKVQTYLDGRSSALGSSRVPGKWERVRKTTIEKKTHGDLQRGSDVGELSNQASSMINPRPVLQTLSHGYCVFMFARVRVALHVAI